MRAVERHCGLTCQTPEALAADGGTVTTAERAARFDRYLVEGGYPEPLLRGASRTDYLRDLWCLTRDAEAKGSVLTIDTC